MNGVIDYKSHVGRGSFRLFAGIAAALTLAGAAAAAGVNTTMWTPRDMQAGIKALGYPKPRPLKVTCRGVGTPAAGGLYTAFHCKTVYRHNQRRSFAVAGATQGGWLCAGRTLHTCKVIPKGFLGVGQVARWGGLEAAAGYTATGYVQQHYKGVQPQSGSPCTQIGGTTRFACVYTAPAATVTVTYKKVTGGWTVSGAG